MVRHDPIDGHAHGDPARGEPRGRRRPRGAGVRRHDQRHLPGSERHRAAGLPAGGGGDGDHGGVLPDRRSSPRRRPSRGGTGLRDGRHGLGRARAAHARRGRAAQRARHRRAAARLPRRARRPRCPARGGPAGGRPAQGRRRRAGVDHAARARSGRVRDVHGPAARAGRDRAGLCDRGRDGGDVAGAVHGAARDAGYRSARTRSSTRCARCPRINARRPASRGRPRW